MRLFSRRRIREIAAVLPVLPDRVDELEFAVGSLGRAFAALPGTHIGRFSVIRDIPDSGVPIGSWLLMCAIFDGQREPYARVLAMATDFDPVFSQCVGWPGSRVPESFVRWLFAHRLRTGFSVEPYSDRTLDEVLGALETHRRLDEFVIANEGAAPADLARAFREAFPA